MKPSNIILISFMLFLIIPVNAFDIEDTVVNSQYPPPAKSVFMTDMNFYIAGPYYNLTTEEYYYKNVTVQVDYNQWNSYLREQNRLLEDQNKLMYINTCISKETSMRTMEACKRLGLFEKYDPIFGTD